MIELIHNDCMIDMSERKSKSVYMTFTDIPYDIPQKRDDGLRLMNKGECNTIDFNLIEFLNEVYRITSNFIIIFCGREQFSTIYSFFTNKKGSTRPLIWQKSNPSPVNGQHCYLNGIEMAVWFKKPSAKGFNAFCKNVVFKHPNGSSKLVKTEKNHKLLKELVLDNSNEGDLIYDPCAGSYSLGLVCEETGRNFIGVEKLKEHFEIGCNRFKKENIKITIPNKE